MRKLADTRALWIVSIIAGILGGVIAVELFCRPVYHISALDVRLTAAPAMSGETRISIPPLGKITARTHAAPMAIQVGVEEARINELRNTLIKLPNGRNLIERVKQEAQAAAVGFGIRLIVFAFAGGAAAVFLLRVGRKSKFIIIGGISGAAFIAINLAVIMATYNISAFKNPQMTNALKATPWALRLVQDGIVKIDELDDRVRMAATSIYRVENTLSGMVSTEDHGEQMRILAISDLHNNPIGMEFAENLARLFDVDLVLNAGDLTDLGTTYENNIAEQATRFSVPQVFVSGNHDSVDTVAALRRTGKVFLPDEQVVEVDGLRIMGQHDPASMGIGPRHLLATPQEIENAKHGLKKAMARLPKPPDILLVHEPDVASAFVGKVPVIVSGHDHTLGADSIKGTAWIRPGSTGASGIRYFIEGSGKSITAAIIYVARTPRPRAVAADLIAVTNPDGEFTVKRIKFAAGG
ncbi:MAG: metallophosphoesterase family protein [Armatimonadota bacterium]